VGKIKMNSVPKEIALIIGIFLTAITIGIAYSIIAGFIFLLVANFALPSIIKFQPVGRLIGKKSF